MRLVLSALLIAHGVAHLVGFVVPWRLMTAADVPYRTTILGDMIDIGSSGARTLGVAWLMAAVAFVLLGIALLAGVNVRAGVLVMLSLSLVLSVLGWPESRIGIAVNAVLLVALLMVPKLGTLSP
jgi:hypothetical protein